MTLSGAKSLQKLFLKRALTAAEQRFGRLRGVVGFGLGHRYLEKGKRFAPKSRAHGGYCIKIYVQAKRPKWRLKPNERIPRSIWVPMDQETHLRRRISLDIVTQPPLELQGLYSHDWPVSSEANRIQPGGLFVSTTLPPTTAGLPLNTGEGQLGTVAALLQVGGEVRALTAAHIFTNPRTSRGGVPASLRGLGINGRKWKPMEDRFHARNPWRGTQARAHFIDGLCFVPPVEDVPVVNKVDWPPGFTKMIATEDEINNLLVGKKANECFVWVERNGVRTELYADLETWIPAGRTVLLGDDAVPYSLLLQLRYSSTQEEPVGGDSGAGVYIRHADSTCSLFGVHVIGVTSTAQNGPHERISYAIFASDALQAAGLTPGNNAVFYG